MKTKALSDVEVAIRAVDDDDEDGPGGFVAILSTGALDRDGEMVDANAFDPLPSHITIDVDHGLSVNTTIGSAVPTYEDGRLIVRGAYSSIPRAQEVRTLVREGHIRTMSAAFMNAAVEDVDGVPHIRSAELLNGAFVAIPSNREALVLAAKSARAHDENPPDVDPDTSVELEAAKAAEGSSVVRQIGPEMETRELVLDAQLAAIQLLTEGA